MRRNLITTDVSLLREVSQERRRQDELLAAGRIPWDCADPAIPNELKLPVLAEEFGEVAKAMLEDEAELRAELIQVAAVAVAWAEALTTGEDEQVAA